MSGEADDEERGEVYVEMLGEKAGNSADLRALAERELLALIEREMCPWPPVQFVLNSRESRETPGPPRSRRYAKAIRRGARRLKADDPRWVSLLHSRIAAVRRNSFVRLGLSKRLAGALVAYDLDAAMVTPDVASELVSALAAYDEDDPARFIIIHEALRRHPRERPEMEKLTLKLLEKTGVSMNGSSPSSISAGPAEALRKAIERSDKELDFIKAHPGATHAKWRKRDEARAAAAEEKAARRTKARRHRPENSD